MNLLMPLLASEAAIATTSESILSPEMVLTLIPAAPLLAAVIIAVFGKLFLKERSHLVTVAALAVSFVMSLLLLFQDLPAAVAASNGTLQAREYGPAVVAPICEWIEIGRVNARVDNEYRKITRAGHRHSAVPRR